MTNAASLVIDISANSQKLAQDLAQSKGKVDAFTNGAIKSVSQMATAFVGAFAFKEILDGFLNLSEHLEDLVTKSRSFGVTVEAFQKLQFIAKSAGVSVDVVTSSLKFLGKNIGAAADGNAKLEESFQKIGLSSQSLKWVSPDQQFMQVGKGLANIYDQTERDTLSAQIFGKSWNEVAGIFTTDMAKAGAEFDKLHTSLTKSQIENVDNFTKVKAVSSTLWDGFKEKTTADFLPTVSAVMKSLNQTATDFGGLEHAALATASILTSSALFVGKAWKTVGDEIKIVLAAFGVLNSMGHSIGEAAFDLSHPDLSIKGNTDPNRPRGDGGQWVGGQVGNTQVSSSIQILKDYMHQFGENTDSLKSLTKADEDLKNLLSKTPNGSIDKALGSTPNGLGFIKNEQTGQSMQYQPQKVDVNTTVKVEFNGDLKNFIRSEVATQVNDVSRGSGR